MELYNLNPSLQPDKLIENYESLIWTERYSKAGDFEIKSSDVNYLINALPRESYVTLRESTVPMVVETHKIEKKPGSAPLITVTGRSFEACALERRASVRDAPGSARNAWLINAAKESDAAYEAMRIVLGDTSRYQGGVQVLAPQNPVVNEDVIPEIDLTLPADYRAVAWSATTTYSSGDIVYYSGALYQATSASGNLNKVPPNATYWTLFVTGAVTTGASNTYEISPDYLYNTVMNLISANHHGIKSVRPGQNSSKFGVEIYNGADLTALYTIDARFDQFDSATYLLSAQGSTNVAYVYGAGGSDKVLKTAGPEPTGLSRRVLFMDLSGDSTTVNSDVRKTRGLLELYNNNVTAMFDGEVAQQVGADYNSKYFLGDIIQLVGEYGLSQNVRVSEFIRSADNQGTKAYPTLEAVV